VFRTPAPVLANAPTLATIGTRRITQLQYLLQLFSRTSENSVPANFGEFLYDELPRIPIPRTPVNKPVCVYFFPLLGA
jgi:hypothetical protein